MKHWVLCLAFAMLVVSPALGAHQPSLFGFGQRKKDGEKPVPLFTITPGTTITPESAKVEAPKQQLLKPVPTFDATKQAAPQQPAKQVSPKQEAPKQVSPKQEAPKPKQEQQKFATCAEATGQIQGYTFVNEALQQCPELMALQHDASVTKTFFVPSDKAIQSLADYSHIPLQMLSSSKVKGMMCNMLKYHVVDGVHLKKTWTVGQKLTTMYNNAELTVSGVGQQPAVTTTTGVQANVKRVIFCGSSVVFGIDAVLTPFKVPRLGLGHH